MATINTTLIIKCVSNLTKITQIEWKQNNKNIATYSPSLNSIETTKTKIQLNVTKSPFNTTINIVNITKAEEGSYKCIFRLYSQGEIITHFNATYIKVFGKILFYF